MRVGHQENLVVGATTTTTTTTGITGMAMAMHMRDGRAAGSASTDSAPSVAGWRGRHCYSGAVFIRVGLPSCRIAQPRDALFEVIELAYSKHARRHHKQDGQQLQQLLQLGAPV